MGKTDAGVILKRKSFLEVIIYIFKIIGMQLWFIILSEISQGYSSLTLAKEQPNRFGFFGDSWWELIQQEKEGGNINYDS